MHNEERSTNDAQLITLIAARDLRALEQFYERYSEVVYGLVLEIVQDRSLADELLQETFLQVWSQAEYVDDTSDIALWLYKIARRRALDALRWSQRTAKQQTELVERICARARTLEPNSATSDFASTVLFDFTNKRVKEQRSAVWQIFASMPEEQRICLSLAYFAGMTDREIASHINRSDHWVKSLIADAVNQLGHDGSVFFQAVRERT